MQYDLGFGASARPNGIATSLKTSRPPRQRGGNEQPLLPGMEPRCGLDNFFFAVRPEPETIPALDTAGAEAARRHGLHGSPLGKSRYHISLQSIMTSEGVPDGLLERLERAAGMIDLPAFEIHFNRIMSFGGRYGKHALVLAGCLSPDMQALYRELGNAMRAVGLRAAGGGFAPHVTLLYDSKRISEEAVAPIAWPVTGFCLIDSLHGRSIHRQAGRWLLQADRLCP